MTRATEFWDREVTEKKHCSWLEHPLVRAYVNQQISGAPGDWPMEWLLRVLDGRTFARGLSIGCGTGALERDVVERGICSAVDAFDGSAHSIRLASRAAAGLPVRYFVADFDRALLPRAHYDIVFFHQSLHHVSNLEGLLGAVMRAMKPGALLYLDEYIGPSRFDWNDALMAKRRDIWTYVPSIARRTNELRLPIEEDDPSEAVRSSEIVEAVRIGFDIRHFRPYGGNYLSVLYPSLDVDALGEERLRLLMIAEQKLLALGEPSFHAVMLAEVKRGWRALAARAAYARMRRWPAKRWKRSSANFAITP